MLPSASSELPSVVVVGGGFAGLRVVRALAKVPANIILIDRANHHVFQPLLYQVATADLSPAEITAPIRSILRHQRNLQIIMAEVINVDTNQRQVILHDDKRISYDYLVLATGARDNYFGHESDWAPFAPGLKSIIDATTIRRKILYSLEQAEIESNPEKRQALMTFVLVGGGPTGVELAGAIAELTHHALVKDFRQIDTRQSKIIIVEALPRILPSFAESLSEKARHELERKGVEVRTNSSVSSINAEGVIASDVRIPSHTVIWTAGVGGSLAGKWLNAPVDRAGRIKVSPDLSVPKHPDIFAIGDTISVPYKNGILPGVAPVAMQEGKYVGRLLKKRLLGKNISQSPFHYFDKGSMAVIGRGDAVAQAGKFRFSGVFGWLIWAFIHIFYLIGFRNRIRVMSEWAWAYITSRPGARLITFDHYDFRKEVIKSESEDFSPQNLPSGVGIK
jgi:NADH dehydrogenase